MQWPRPFALERQRSTAAHGQHCGRRGRRPRISLMFMTYSLIVTETLYVPLAFWFAILFRHCFISCAVVQYIACFLSTINLDLFSQIIYLGTPDGPTCHTGAETCYYTRVSDLLEPSEVCSYNHWWTLLMFYLDLTELTIVRFVTGWNWRRQIGRDYFVLVRVNNFSAESRIRSTPKWKAFMDEASTSWQQLALLKSQVLLCCHYRCFRPNWR